MTDQPREICQDCGRLYGYRPHPTHPFGVWHGTCGVCGEEGTVTAPRDYGYLKDEWKHHNRAALKGGQL